MQRRVHEAGYSFGSNVAYPKAPKRQKFDQLGCPRQYLQQHCHDAFRSNDANNVKQWPISLAGYVMDRSSSTAMATTPKAVKADLMLLLKRPENMFCADCRMRGTVSLNADGSPSTV
jgi:hypothetical protein